jgi:hypothetical protein
MEDFLLNRITDEDISKKFISFFGGYPKEGLNSYKKIVEIMKVKGLADFNIIYQNIIVLILYFIKVN